MNLQQCLLMYSLQVLEDDRPFDPFYAALSKYEISSEVERQIERLVMYW